ncbi:MAG: GNAT family N-acetyltransferase [Candidatus Rokubacteria bacterium]|nr:GNAT family N-acetyltransferase [Candidatus Rokubacteria bacterium]
MELEVRRIRPEDAETLAALRRKALEAHPLAFGASIEDDHVLSPDFMPSLAQTEDSVVFGVFVDGSLGGMVGVHRGRHVKARHTAHVWGMYVSARFRCRGAGAALLRAAIEHARAWSGVVQVELAVSDAAPAARRLYDRAGFREWGREPRALSWQGRTVDEAHLVLEL